MKTFNNVAIPETLRDAVRPDRAALVVYDMQVGIVRQLPQGNAVLDKVLTVLEQARSAGVRIVFMRHMSLPKFWSGAFALRQMMVWQRKTSPDDVHPWFLRSNPAFELTPELAVRDDEAVLDKVAMSAFEGTPLAMALRDCGLSTFVIAGIATEIGIEPTVRHGTDLGFFPIVVTDACGAGHADAGERAVTQMQFTGDAMLCTTDELTRAWTAQA